MRVTVTVVQQGEEPRDVLLTVDENTTVADLAGALAAQAAPSGGGSVVQLFPDGQRHTATPSPTLWADGHRCPPDAPARHSQPC